MKKPHTIFLDIDGTVTSGEVTAWDLITTNLDQSLEEHHHLLLLLRNGEITTQEAINGLSNMWKNADNHSKEMFIKIFEQIEIRDDVIPFREYLKQNSIELVLLSGTPDLNLNRIKQKLDIEHGFTSTKFIFDEDSNFSTFVYEVNEAEEKLNIFSKYLIDNNLSPEQVWMIGDGSNDLEVMKKSAFSAAPRYTVSDKILDEVDMLYESMDEIVEILKKLD